MPQADASNHFDSFDWHDNAVYGMRLEVGDPDRGMWHSRLILDIDYILEWICGTDGRFHCLRV